MRFNALGPQPPAPSRVGQVVSLAMSPNALTIAACFVVLLFGFGIISWMDASSNDALARATKRESQAEIIHSHLLLDQAQLAELTSIAKSFGDVRRSGYNVAHALVAIGDAWPDPRVSQVSMKCQTPNDDGSVVTLTAESRDYAGSVGTIKSLSRHGYFALPNMQNRKGSKYEFSVEVRP